MQLPEVFSISSSQRRSIPEIQVIDLSVPRNKFQKFFDSVKNTFFEYCSVSSINGCSHLISNSLFYRKFWLILFITCFLTCYFSIVKLLGSREILVLYEKNTISTSEIPFPAITVCTSVKADHRRFNYSDRNLDHKLTSFELNKNGILNRILFEEGFYMPERSTGGNLATPLDLHDVETHIKELGLKEEDLIVSCSFNNKPCKWSQIFTPDGLCYAFNLVRPEEMFKENIYEQYKDRGIPTKGWSYKKGYDDKLNTDVYPLRGFYFHQLKMRLQMHSNDLINSNKLNGFTIYAGHPIDYPYHKENRIFIPPNVQYTLTVTPDVIFSQDELKNYPFNLRNCFIKTEEWKHMKIFKEYSLNNCHLDCMAKMINKTCNCIPFYIPGTFSNKTCGKTAQSLGQIYCYKNSIYIQMYRETIATYHPINIGKQCNCIPACSSINYVIQEQITGTISIPNDTFYFSDVTVKFSSSEILPKMRQESYSNLNLISAIGSNLGLFVGASVTSFFELFYYFFIKLFINLFNNFNA